MLEQNTLGSGQPIVIQVTWEPMSSGTLGASAPLLFRDFPNAPEAGAFYPAALVNTLCGGCVGTGYPHLYISLNSE